MIVPRWVFQTSAKIFAIYTETWNNIILQIHLRNNLFEVIVKNDLDLKTLVRNQVKLSSDYPANKINKAQAFNFVWTSPKQGEEEISSS